MAQFIDTPKVPDLTPAQISALKPIQAPGLYFNYKGEKRVPCGLYFSSDARLWHNDPEDYEGRLYTHFDNALRPVYGPDGRQFERRGLACVCARYKDGIITDFYHE